MGIDDLVNKGFCTINAQNTYSDDKKTIVVVGVARGGTSIVSGILYHLGVFVGDKANPPVFEDVRLSNAFENTSEETFEDVVGDYNSRFDVWAWKRPSVIEDLERVKEKVRNPFFIYIFRDLLSVANRNKISMGLDIIKGMKKAFQDYEKIVDFLSLDGAPALLVSSDKIIKYRSESIKEIVSFLSLDVTETMKKSAIDFISNKPVQYLDSSRITKVQGYINSDLIQKGILRGWARNVHNLNKVSVDVRVNGELLLTLVADKFFQHLKDHGAHPTGECGFECDLKSAGVNPNDRISVRAKGDVVDLNNSPVHYEELMEWKSA